MEKASFGTNDVVIKALQKHSDMVRRICFMYLRNHTDVEDVFQEVFLKLLQSEIAFENDEHIKAWLCRVTINKCKDVCKSFFKKNICSIEDMELSFEDKKENDVMAAVLSLPSKYKDVIYLFYYEEYTVPQMAKLLHQKENSIYSNLHRARKLLRQKLGGSDHEYNY
ncbi:MAG TPA: sigma-70 family RNA polymerase sigma factor [Clostridia bacterium]|nr:sigma-70 family RNA polymerase sigma factor [Clostridia bacterium]